MQFDPTVKPGVFSTSLYFRDGIVLERVKAAKADEALRIQSGLRADPVVLSFYPSVFILRLPSRPPIGVCRGQKNPSIDARRVQQLYDVFGSDRNNAHLVVALEN